MSMMHIILFRVCLIMLVINIVQLRRNKLKGHFLNGSTGIILNFAKIGIIIFQELINSIMMMIGRWLDNEEIKLINYRSLNPGGGALEWQEGVSGSSMDSQKAP